MEFRILGPLEVEEEGRTIPLAGAKQRSLLALLLLARRQGGARPPRLIDEIWDGAPPATALENVQVYVSQLRAALGDGRLIRREHGYELRVAPGELDADRFDEFRLIGVRRRAGGCGRAPPGGAHPVSRRSALRPQPRRWAQPEIARLEERRVMALEARIDADLSLGRHRELVPELDALVATHPFREHLLEQLVLALYRSGRQAGLSTRTAAGRHDCGTSSASSRAAGCRSSSSASCARIRCSTLRQRALPAFRRAGGAGSSC